MCSTPHRTSDISLKTARPSKPFRMVKSEQSRWRSFFPIIQNQFFPKLPVVPFRPSTKSAWNAYASGGIPPRKLIASNSYFFLQHFPPLISSNQRILWDTLYSQRIVSFVRFTGALTFLWPTSRDGEARSLWDRWRYSQMFPATRCQGARLHRWIAQPSPLHQSQGHQASGDGTSDEGAWLCMARHG